LVFPRNNSVSGTRNDFASFPSDDANAGIHRYIVEFQDPPQHLTRFGQFLDDALRRMNENYDAQSDR